MPSLTGVCLAPRRNRLIHLDGPVGVAHDLFLLSSKPQWTIRQYPRPYPKLRDNALTDLHLNAPHRNVFDVRRSILVSSLIVGFPVSATPWKRSLYHFWASMRGILPDTLCTDCARNSYEACLSHTHRLHSSSLSSSTRLGLHGTVLLHYQVFVVVVVFLSGNYSLTLVVLFRASIGV